MTATMSQQTTTKTVAGMARCRKCKAAKRVEGTSTRRLIRMDRWNNPVYSRDVRFVQVQCWNGCVSRIIGTNETTVEINQIRGTVTDQPCDARCTSAKGHNCECSCGGKNHGSQA